MLEDHVMQIEEITLSEGRDIQTLAEIIGDFCRRWKNNRKSRWKEMS